MPIPRPTIEQILAKNADHHCKDPQCVRVSAVANLPSRFGDFQVVAFESNTDEREHAAFVHGDICNREDVPVRVHSECLTGDAIGSLRCDCRDQLEAALKAIGSQERGIVLYLRQEGRGIGFVNKIKAYQLQDGGYDTVDANLALGFGADERDYAIAAHMLGSLHVKSIQLMTNNPDKIGDLKAHGIRVKGRIPIVMEPNPHNAAYLETKRRKAGHLLEPVVEEQADDLAAASRA
jgi:GTP cyclohydrolase II